MRYDGVDLSHFQSGLSLNLKAKGPGRSALRFLYHKASEGTGFVDPTYAARRAEAKAAGVPFGAYHFAHPAPGTAAAEAAHFMATAKPEPGDLLPALDLEVNEHGMSRAALTTWVHTFFEAVYKHTGVRKGVLYTHYDLNTVPGTTFLWVPRYSNDNRAPVIPTPFKRYSVWQFSDGVYGNPRTAAGVGSVDLNHLHWAARFRLGQMRLPVKKAKPAKASKAKPAGGTKAKPKQQAVKQQFAVVKSGDSLSKIAQAHGLTLKQIENLNPQIKNPNVIYVGDKIRVK